MLQQLRADEAIFKPVGPSGHTSNDVCQYALSAGIHQNAALSFAGQDRAGLPNGQRRTNTMPLVSEIRAHGGARFLRQTTYCCAASQNLFSSPEQASRGGAGRKTRMPRRFSSDLLDFPDKSNNARKEYACRTVPIHLHPNVARF
jgi:hypothetical protein